MYYPRLKYKDKVPILSSIEIDSIAEQFVMDYDASLLEIPKAFDVERFIEFYLNVEMEFDDLSIDNSCLGMTVFNDTDMIEVYDSENSTPKYISAKAGTIIIDNSLLEHNQEKRMRFTLGHEAGHWILHKEYYGYNPNQISMFSFDEPFTRCRNINSNYTKARTTGWDGEKWMEWQADKFAAALLMPRSSMKKILGQTKIIYDAKKAYKTMVAMSEIFNVSKQAALYRLCDLGYVRTSDFNKVNNQISMFD